ncbi:MAG: lysophospholipid acyltransferase family protein [Lentisphaeraceae bacterium]|nr:lysophospholipid acyltransferase family protein [Lentisphaeraceae bacterium]
MKKLLKPGSIPYKILFFFVILFVKTWLKTLRVKMIDPRGVNKGQPEQNFVAVMWHNRIFVASPLFHVAIRKNTYGMASRSKDGQIISDTLGAFKINTLRGSASKKGKSKGGAAVLIACIKVLKEGHNISVTPDGPRGPKYEVQPGAIVASIKSKVPVQPFSMNCHNCWTLKSWDKLQLPKPFSKVDFVVGDQIQFEGPMDEESMEKNKQTLKDALMKITVDY